jgi:hypothetical protein
VSYQKGSYIVEYAQTRSILFCRVYYNGEMIFHHVMLLKRTGTDTRMGAGKQIIASCGLIAMQLEEFYNGWADNLHS